MKKHFRFLILILLVLGMSACKKKVVPPTNSNPEYDASMVNGNYHLTKFHYFYSSWSGFYTADTVNNLNLEVTRLNNNRISFLGYNLKMTSADSIIISFAASIADTNRVVSLDFFIANDSICFYDTEEYFPNTTQIIYSGRKQ